MSGTDAGVPLALRVFLAFLAPFTAIAALAGEGTLPSLGAAVALALAGHGAVEMPPCAWMLILAALALALVSHDPRSVWASLGATKPVADSS
jgi:hypothetical protein